ncbi:MAG: hypothetical protein HOE90_02800 [Bacteriovoracaceae bacterium]|nr:hypothetical protein [Bacteriovoracaceae bacterium]
MKILILTFILSFSAYAEISLKLESSRIHLGEMEQLEGSTGHLVVRAIRTSETPEEVDIIVNYDYQSTRCGEWIAGYWDYSWNTRNRRRNRNWRRYRTRRRHVGHWGEYPICIFYEDVVLKKTRKIELDFEDAATLDPGEVEEFLIHLDQEKFDSDDLDISARVLESQHNYKIKVRSRFSGKKIKFKLR